MVRFLKAEREKRGCSKEEFAHQANIPYGTYAKYEAGTALPGWNNAEAMANVLGIEHFGGVKITLDDSPNRVHSLMDVVTSWNISDEKKSDILLAVLKVMVD